MAFSARAGGAAFFDILLSPAAGRHDAAQTAVR